MNSIFEAWKKLYRVTSLAEQPDVCQGSIWSSQDLKHHGKHRAFSITMRCFGDVFEKNIVYILDDVFQNAKHRANDAPNDVNRPPLVWPGGVMQKL